MSFGIATGALVEGRDDWERAIGRVRAVGWPFVELTAIDEERLDALVALFERSPEPLDGVERVSVHAPVRFRTSVLQVVEKLEALPELDVVVHPDVYRGELRLLGLGRRLLVENMDVQKAFGRFAPDLRVVFETFPEAGLCLDVAHVWTNDPSLRLGHDLLDEFGGRLRQVHVSGIEADGAHRETTAADLDLYAPLLERCRHVPWILEAELAEPGSSRRAVEVRA